MATAYSIKKLFFCNKGVSFQDSWIVDEEYIEELKDESKNEKKIKD